MTEKLDNDFDSSSIQAMINNSIANSNRDLEEFIRNQAGIQVSNAMAGYAKTSNLKDLEDSLKKYLTQNDLDGYLTEGNIDTILKDYVTSTAFTKYTADANTNFASAATIVANSKFYYEKNTDASSSNYGNLCLVDRSGKVTDFIGIRDFYERGTITENGETKSVKDKVNPDKLPDDEALVNSDILPVLIKLCEQNFKTISTEMATIKAEVGDGNASFDILAAVQGENGQQIAAGIFGWANKENSKLVLYGDQIELNAEHKLKLKTGTFEVDSKEMSLNSAGKLTIDSENFKLNDTGLLMRGNIYATNLNDNITAGVVGERKNSSERNNVRFFAGTNIEKTNDTYALDRIEEAPFRVYDDGHVVAKDIELVFNGNRTSIDENGVLRASGAVIDGDVTANKIEVTSSEKIWEVTKENQKYSGKVEIETKISAENFRMAASGVLHDVSDNTIEIDKNKNFLELTVLPYAHNTEDNELGSDLYGVPTLCMYYNGVPFVLSPATWVTRSSVTGNGNFDSSNMRWIKQYDTYNYSEVNEIGAYYSLTSGNFSTLGKYYIAFPDKIKNHIGYPTDEDELCRLIIYDWGPNKSEKVGLLAGSSGDVNLLMDADKGDGIFILKSSIKDNSTYAYSAHASTCINESNCKLFRGWIPKNSYKIGTKCRFKYFTEFLNDEDASTVRNETKFGIDHICDFIHYIVESQDTPQMGDKTGCWGGSGEYIKIKNFSDILPFCKNTPATSRFYESGDGSGQYLEINIDYYPLLTINESGIPNSTVDKIYGNCCIEMHASSYNIKLEYQKYKEDGGWYNLTNGELNSYLDSMDFILKFDFYLKLSTQQTFDHLCESNEAFDFGYDTDSELNKRYILKNVIKTFFEDENVYKNIDPSDVDFSGEIKAGEYIYRKTNWNKNGSWTV